MNDYIFKATAFNNTVRILTALTTNMANEAVRIHGAYPLSAAALCRTLTAAAMLGRTLKNDGDLLSVIIKGQGPIGSIIVTTDSSSNVKGYIENPFCELPLKENGKLDLRTGIGEGTLSIVRDMGLKEPYTGKIPLVSGEIADDLTYYFAKSEQIPCSVALGEIINRDIVASCGGMIIQLMPGAEAKTGDIIHDRLTQLPPISELLAQGETPEQLAARVFKDFDLEPDERLPLFYHCGCSRKKMEKALMSIGKTELNTIIEEDKKAEIHCHFCNETYLFTEEDLKRLLLEGISNGYN